LVSCDRAFYWRAAHRNRAAQGRRHPFERWYCIHRLQRRRDDQNLKTASSARSVPIHRDLIACGFLDYVAIREKDAAVSETLWPEFASPIASKVKLWSKWFGRYLGDHVVDHPSKTFHSFRHTFKRACREAGISGEVHHAFTGHSGGGVGRSYGRMRRSDGVMDRGISLERLKAEIDRIDCKGLMLPKHRPD
jgi:integrase